MTKIKLWRCPTCGCVGRILHNYHGGCEGYQKAVRPQGELFPEVAFPPVYLGET